MTEEVEGPSPSFTQAMFTELLARELHLVAGSAAAVNCDLIANWVLGNAAWRAFRLRETLRSQLSQVSTEVPLSIRAVVYYREFTAKPASAALRSTAVRTLCEQGRYSLACAGPHAQLQRCVRSTLRPKQVGARTCRTCARTQSRVPTCPPSRRTRHRWFRRASRELSSSAHCGGWIADELSPRKWKNTTGDRKELRKESHTPDRCLLAKVGSTRD